MSSFITNRIHLNHSIEVSRRSHNVLITSTALALLISAGAAYAASDTLPMSVPADDKLVLENESLVYGGGATKIQAIDVNAGAALTTISVDINSNSAGKGPGETAAIIRAGENSHVNLTGGTLTTSGAQFTRGILALGGSSLTTDGTSINTVGVKSHAVHAFNGGAGTLTGGTLSTAGSDSYGAYAQNAGSSLTLNNVDIETDALNGFGVFTYNEGQIAVNGGSITTQGEKGHGVVAGLNSSIVLDGTSIQTEGSTAWGLVADQENSAITATDVNVVTSGKTAYGVYAKAASAANAAIITLNGGSITTNNQSGRYENTGRVNSHGLYADGSRAAIIADGTNVETFSQYSHGAFIVGGASATFSDMSITTNGFMSYGVYLWGANSRATLTNVNVTTNGPVGDAVTALDGSRIEIDGGIFTVHGEPNPSSPHEVASGLLSAGEIDARNVTVVTYGANSRGIRAGLNAGGIREGTLTLTDSSVTVKGENAIAAEVAYGGSISTVRSNLTSEQGVGIRLYGNATIDLVDTTVRSGKETILSSFSKSGESQSITIGGNSVATENNGTLLRVTRNAAGSDGEVTLALGAGSTSSGDIIDLDTRTGGTDVTLEEGATWTGRLAGVRNFFGFQGGSVDFTERAEVSGSLNGSGTNYIFSVLGGSIGENVNLNDGSTTTGGSIDNRIIVGGNVNVDDTSILGGNWSIEGNLSSRGILRPGNSIGRVDVDGDVNLFASSVYEVDVDKSGDADLITVGDVANLDGTVVVTAMDGYKLASPYTILTAGTIDGEFQSASLAQPSAFLEANLAHGANDVTLTIDRNATSFESVADTSNQAAVAGALDRMDLSNPVVAAIALSSSTEARDAFQQLSGDTNASVKTGLIETANLTADAINNRLRSAFDGVGAANMPVLSFAQSSNSAAGSAIDDVSASPSYNYAFWATGFGSWIDHDGNANAGGMKTSTGGFLSGLDVGFASGWRLGIVGGYSETDMDAKGRHASAKSDNWHLGIYGGNQWGALGVRGGLIHTWHDVDSSRSVVYGGLGENLNADYDARTLQAFAEVGYQIDMAPVSFEPFANLSHVRLRTDGFTESGGDAALAATSETTNTTFTTLGLRASAPFQFSTTGANLKGMIGWRHAYGDRTPIATQAFAGGDAFTVQGIPIAKDAALFEAGMDFHISQAATFGVSYVGQFGSKTTQNGFNASFNVKF